MGKVRLPLLMFSVAVFCELEDIAIVLLAAKEIGDSFAVVPRLDSGQSEKTVEQNAGFFEGNPRVIPFVVEK
jgi:hypothetical protein